MSTVRDVDSFWGSHTGSLDAALRSVAPGSLVIEHGVGLYSSPMIARYDVRVLAIEEWPGWTSWARWLYELAGRDVSFLDRAKLAVPRLADAALVFVDGAARERGDLLKWSLDAGVRCVIAHDTEDANRTLYGYHNYMFRARGYAVSHDLGPPRTTTWTRAEAQ